MNTIRTRTTYLEMRTPQTRDAELPSSNVVVRRLVTPSVNEYRELYRGVGEQWNWIDRLLMDDDELKQLITSKHVEIYVLQVDRQVAGFAELDRRKRDEIELAYFGLLPDFIGRGLGKFFIQWTINQAWSYQPFRFWLHTCDLDHPAALTNYLKAGFEIYDAKMVEQVVSE